jgi:hypothetical protein
VSGSLNLNIVIALNSLKYVSGQNGVSLSTAIMCPYTGCDLPNLALLPMPFPIQPFLVTAVTLKGGLIERSVGLVLVVGRVAGGVKRMMVVPQ